MQQRIETTRMSTTLDYAKARENMVEQQVRPWDVLNLRVLDVLATLPRETFLPPALRPLAYADMELPLAHGQTTNKPVFEGRALQALALEPGDEVLEIGAGCGYLSACLGRLARDVVSLELYPDLAKAAQAAVDAQRISNVRIETANVFEWNNERRFDAICVGAAVATVPQLFRNWLKPEGRLFVVHGHRPAMEAMLLRNHVNGHVIESLFETDLPYLVGAAPAPEFKL